MSAVPGGLLGSARRTHPEVRARRIRAMLLTGASVVIPLALVLAIDVEWAHPSLVLLVAVVVAVAAVVGLMVSTRYEITVMVVALYLGMLDGPLKLSIASGHSTVSAARDVLIGAICLGALLRIFVKRERVALPPLAIWPLLFAAVVVTEAFNPQTHGFVKALAGFRQLLEWVPFFFFGYALLRTKRRFRQLFWIIGVIALANAVVGVYQTRITPTSLATWGPGYRELVDGSEAEGGTPGITSRTFKSEGEVKVRPPALGGDAGFGGGLGVIALPAALALLAGGSLRRRWPALILALGAMLGVATAQGRLQALGAAVALLLYTGLLIAMRRRGEPRKSLRPLLSIVAVLLLAIPVGAVAVSALGKGSFGRFNSFVTGGSDDSKLPGLESIPRQVMRVPFGIGLGETGAAAGFGGLDRYTNIFSEQRQVASSNQYNVLVDEVGVLGLLAWVGYAFRLILLYLRRMRRVRDTELRSDLIAVLASFCAILFMGVSGPTLTSPALGPFFWLAGGVGAYWFLGPGRKGQAPPSGVVPSPVTPPEPTQEAAVERALVGAGTRW